MRIPEIIGESPQSDRLMRNTARRVISHIMKATSLEVAVIQHVNKAGIPHFYPLAYTPTIYPNMVVGLLTDSSGAANLVDLSRNESTLPDSVAYVIGYPVRREYRYPEAASFDVMLKIAEQYKPSIHLLQAKLENIPTFVHEFTHYWDMSRAAARLPPTSAGKDLAKYFNNPLERNAYFQEAMAKIDKDTRAFRLPFEAFLRTAMRKFDQDFLVNLTEASRRRLLSRLYVVWQSKHSVRQAKPEQGGVGF